MNQNKDNKLVFSDTLVLFIVDKCYLFDFDFDRLH